MRRIAILALLAAFGVGTPALADGLPEPIVRGADAPPAPVVTQPTATYTTPQTSGGEAAAAYATVDGGQPIRRACCNDPYHPSLPMGETRSAWTAPAVSPTPFALTAGEAMTPMRGRLALNFTRISDERFADDLAGRRWRSDGEVRVISLEAVSPRYAVNLGSMRVPMHISASLHAYTLNHALFDRLRNWVEEELLGAGTEILSNHDIGGRELDIAGDTLLGSSPLWKARFAVKVPLPETCICNRRLLTAVSVGLTTPAFGSHDDAGNEDLQPDVTLAYLYPISRRLWFTGAATVSLPGSTERFDRLGVETNDVLFGWNGNLEYWFSSRFAFAAGFQFQSAYLDGTGISMDESSTFFNLAFLWRPCPKHTFHLTWSENPQTEIPFGAERNFTNSQTDADFTFLFGWRYSL